MHCCADPNRIPRRIFRPDYNEKALTTKFYARHDNFDYLTHDIDISRYNYYANNIEYRYKYDARKVLTAPITTNQTYGWLEHYAEHYEGLDKKVLQHALPYDSVLQIIQNIAFETDFQKKYMKRFSR